jgi:hypothetical protein
MLYHEDTPAGSIPYMEIMKARFVTNLQKPVPSFDGINGTVDAEVNHGRWLAQCPRCPNAIMLSRDALLFLCDNCGEGWLNVTWPLDREEIEATLQFREDDTNRNWTPNETTDDLRKENNENGLDGT